MLATMDRREFPAKTHTCSIIVAHFSKEVHNSSPRILMPIAVGSRIGPFEVRAFIGEGGMGRVFRALDTKLQRDVALKVLPDDFSNDPERISRFHREAQALAVLNHSNIAQIYGFEDSTGSRCLVLELVDG